ncbi:hypothetical protein K443DRAFT_237533 [Laccaria amethystina LaAM-08-1]|uniref:Uncharacterized protein n=1 Tax=Laccaria amethystina LaAM-08-1 TaxID=1095629 RepID=A0A0C9X8L2_9AGAR|nr:hypothetical protein K443DRAFT_237533 [Laccaria amethystina LaAM-08-1]
MSTVVKSLLSQSPPTPLPFFSHSCCLIRDTLSAQSDCISWILITVSSTRFHRLRVPLPWSYHLLSVVFLTLGRERRLSLYIPCDPGIDVRMLSRNPRKLFPPTATAHGKVCTFRYPTSELPFTT